MNTRRQIGRTAGMTLIDTLMVAAVLLLLAALLLPHFARARVRRSDSSCVNRLKQVGLAYRVWSGDNQDRFPMQVPLAQGGSMEAALAGDAVATYRCMSNELSTPKILLCPTDSARDYATNFANLSTNHISYFVGLDANETNVLSLLSGDRNITYVSRPKTPLLFLSTNSPASWTDELHRRAGNVAFGDGGVSEATTPGLQSAIAATGLQTNRIVLP